jgi:hypothetical protein
MPSLAGVNLALLAGSIVAVYLLGYVTGAWLIPPADARPPMALGIVRLVSGLFLSATLFMLSMAIGLPWWSGPAAGVIAALATYRRGALALPVRPSISGWDQVAGCLVALIYLAPMFLASLRMAPGDYPPMFFSVDTPYFLEKVHALVRSNELPPPSLGMLGGKYVYHYGSHATAALLSRVSALPPHHTLFLVLTPLLLIGMLAAAIVAVRAIGPRLPWVVALPLLLVATPSLWYPYWHELLPRLEAAVSESSLRPLGPLAAEYELWGVANINGQNLASEFIVLGAIGGIAAARARGWRLPVFLIGSAILFKAQSAIALLGGFVLMQGWETFRTRSPRPLIPLAGTLVVFAIVYSALWILPQLPVTYRTELHLLSYVDYLRDRARVGAFAADLAWMMVPALWLWRGSRPPADRSRLALLILALTPLVILNTTRGLDLRAGRGYDEDWFQIVIVVPMLMHAFVLTVAEWGWGNASPLRKAIFVILVALAIVPPLVPAIYYSTVLVRAPQAGHEFVDNHQLGAALRAIPVTGSLLVTNDLRYPAGDFARTNRQMQIPALYGHQAFAINYAYEVYDFSEERMRLQRLLEATEWTPEIDAAARKYGWTHFIVRKDYAHPQQIPLTQVFDGPEYAVFRFPPAA